MKAKKIFMRVIDILMIAAMLLLMAMQVTKQEIHEWLGIGMFALVIAHNILNRNYYAAIFRGKYTPIRVFMLIVNTALLLSFVATPITGMLMSRYATPFLDGVVGVIWPRKLHLMLSYWSFVLMGMHAGLHLGIISSKLKNKAVRITAFILMCGISVYGFYLFIQANIFDYMLMKTHFAFLDYSKAWWLVILENLAMLIAWAFIAYLVSLIFKMVKRKGKES
ncbi:MAG: DUF4405 domain-containing protein [Ruminococcus sp.]|uniref:DUF4405 domain-containing protein n=1 Tax=Ruminococcus sp. TaxID=41978 RepID=UPI002872D3C0|nr:DUF4405 domain-containing protein [Ruminococcus sp.]MBQ3285277.1 DUF4405 domain-containing protein [Ruminococcus sp.]